jgi:hypothetical protein
MSMTKTDMETVLHFLLDTFNIENIPITDEHIISLNNTFSSFEFWYDDQAYPEIQCRQKPVVKSYGAWNAPEGERGNDGI